MSPRARHAAHIVIICGEKAWSACGQRAPLAHAHMALSACQNLTDRACCLLNPLAGAGMADGARPCATAAGTTGQLSTQQVLVGHTER